MSQFPNKAGDHADTDDVLRAELKAAGIPTVQEADGKPPEFMADVLRGLSGEVKTSVAGSLHGWKFERAWNHWACSGPGIEVAAAEALHANHGAVVRVEGGAGAGPLECFSGLACGAYHVDTPDGLKALADTIRVIVRQAAAKQQSAGGPTSLTLKSRSAAPFRSREERSEFAVMVADIMSAGASHKFEPTTLNNPVSGMEWVVDAGNDWWVFFDATNELQVRIQHRYGDVAATRALCDWIASRRGMEVLGVS